MANETLKNAINNAGMTPEEFAAVIQVDPKSVQRWIAGATTPYPRHRAKISRALALPENQLWPRLSPRATGDTLDPVEFVASATDDTDLLDGDHGFELSPGLIDALLQQAQAGRQIRLLTHRPATDLTPAIGHQHVDIRALDLDSPHSLIRIGDLMLLALNLAGETDKSELLLKLTRTDDDAVFGRLTGNFELLWKHAEQRLPEPAPVAYQLTDASQADNRSRDAAEPPESASSTASVVVGPEPRRWPGRPA